jgi:hypothetical protein
MKRRPFFSTKRPTNSATGPATGNPNRALHAALSDGLSGGRKISVSTPLKNVTGGRRKRWRAKCARVDSLMNTTCSAPVRSRRATNRFASRIARRRRGFL